MKKYLVIYHAPTMMPKDMPKEEMQAEQQRWMDWAGKCGDKLVEMGAPLQGGMHHDGNEAKPSERMVSGYSILQAENMDEALGLMEGHPHFGMPDSAGVEVHEMVEMQKA